MRILLLLLRAQAREFHLVWPCHNELQLCRSFDFMLKSKLVHVQCEVLPRVAKLCASMPCSPILT